MRVNSNHPSSAEMVDKAIKTLKPGRSGVSFHAIKKYISSHYLIEYERYAHYIKKYLKNAVDSGILIQIRGKGASGSFKINRLGEKTKASRSYIKHSKPVKTKRLNRKTYKWSKEEKRRERSTHSSYYSCQNSTSSRE